MKVGIELLHIDCGPHIKDLAEITSLGNGNKYIGDAKIETHVKMTGIKQNKINITNSLTVSSTFKIHRH